jgi:hypothetical protein
LADNVLLTDASSGILGSDFKKRILACVREFEEFKAEIREEVRSRKSSSAGSQVDDIEEQSISPSCSLHTSLLSIAK